MRVIMIMASLPPLPSGGAEWQALRLGEELSKRGISVTFLTPGKGTVKGTGTINGMPVHRLTSPFSRAFERLSAGNKAVRKDSAKPTRIEYDDDKETTNEITRGVGWPTVVYYSIFYWQCLRFLRQQRNQFDVIHAHTMEWSAIVAARLGKRFKKPVLIKDSTMNGFRSLRRFPNGSNLQNMIIGNAEFVAMTGVIEQNFRLEGIPASKIHRIPNGIAVTGTPRLLHDLTMPGTSGMVLFVGNLYQQPAKGVDILLRAWRIISERLPHAILTIVGDGDLPAYQAYTAEIGISGSVRFIGKETDLSPYYRDAQVFVLPSRREGMSNALMEAMLAGLPCVATDISGSQDLIRSGSSGILVPPGDIAALAKAIEYMLTHPAEALEMGIQAKQTILEKCDIRVVAEKYIALYNKLR